MNKIRQMTHVIGRTYEELETAEAELVKLDNGWHKVGRVDLFDGSDLPGGRIFFQCFQRNWTRLQALKEMYDKHPESINDTEHFDDDGSFN